MRPPRPPRPPEWAAPAFVWAVWAVMVLAALDFVRRFAGNIPVWDDWNFVPFLTGHREVSAAWLWEQHNEHRVPVPKLLLLALYRLTGNDFRAGAFFNVCALAALALVLILAARRARGRTSYADAFFPLVLLHWGQSENYLISFTVNLVLPTILAGVVLAVLVRGGPLTAGAAVLAGGCLLLLPLCGASGVVLGPPLALWLGLAGARPRWVKLLAVGLAAGAAALALAALLGYQRPHYSYDPRGASLRAYARTAAQVLSVSLGSGSQSLWPLPALAVAGLVLFGLALLARAWRARPPERDRVLGLFAFSAGVLSLVAAMGWGRSTGGPDVGFQSRYATLAVPLLCGAYFVCDLYAPPAAGARARAGLFGAACVMLVPNALKGLEEGRAYRRGADAFVRDLRAGEPPYRLLRRHSAFLFFSLHERLAEGVGMLHRAGVGPFRHLRPDPPFREIPLPSVPSEVARMDWEGAGGRGTGPDPHAVFALARPRYVAGVRVTYSYPEARAKPVYFRAYWWNSGGGDDHRDRSYVNTFLERSPDERTLTIWIDDTVDRFRIHPDNGSCVFRLSEVVLLVPAGPGEVPRGP